MIFCHVVTRLINIHEAHNKVSAEGHWCTTKMATEDEGHPSAKDVWSMLSKSRQLATWSLRPMDLEQFYFQGVFLTTPNSKCQVLTKYSWLLYNVHCDGHRQQVRSLKHQWFKSDLTGSNCTRPSFRHTKGDHGRVEGDIPGYSKLEVPSPEQIFIFRGYSWPLQTQSSKS